MLCLAAIFAAGLVSGSMITLRIVKRAAGRNLNPDGWATTAMQAYRKKLKLTPEQIQKIQPAMDQAAQEIRAIGGSATVEIFSVVIQLNDRVAKELTPEQQKRLEEMKQEFRAKWKDRAAAKPFRK